MDDESLLAAIYRGRPATTGELATLTHLTEHEADSAVERLRRRGLLGGESDSLTYLHPATWAAETVSERSADLRRRSHDALVDMEQLVAGLPAMLRHWSVGEASADPVPVHTRHGPLASEDLWYETARHDSGVLRAVIPEIGRFLSSGDERVTRFAGALGKKEAVRVIVPTSATDDPQAIERMQRYGAAGVEFRLLDDPPSWFWVDGEHLAVPFEWGEGRPTSVLGVRNGALAALTGAYFENLWQRADPTAPLDHSWTPLLRLMRRGITLEAASRRVGINPRTGRRRIAAAMTHYGVSTLFALGVAWSADSDRAR